MLHITMYVSMRQYVRMTRAMRVPHALPHSTRYDITKVVAVPSSLTSAHLVVVLVTMSKPKRPPHHANTEGTLFRNPWDDKERDGSSFSISSLPRFLKDGWAEFPLEWAKEHTDNPHKPVTVVNPTFGLGLTGKEDRGKEIKATWLGHAVRLHPM